ncbi:N-acetylmuramoyl-L-alanine amidase [Bacillus sp. FJAT-42376]|uniref:SH3 domain-containing protein n=1 Tax=Bacillus sp. FJAT-42376 TaxID=2014076 RepID=UPI000F4E01D1|nr:SH3 domain-containing protein [Bacillus sp. FJAT-42376]AZB44403.1 N-acetylmuramoyl-L-alanine amidase [Bacillus sp. FJAT-42376]
MKTSVRKGLLIAGLLSATVFGSFSSGALTVAAASQQGVVKADVLNVRSAASINSSIVMQVKHNQAVHILDQKSGWTKIQSGKKTGWVKSSYLNVKQVTAAALKTAKVNASSLNVRSTPSTSGKVVMTLKRNASVTLMKTQNGWSQVSASGKTGWVNAKYLTASGTPAAPAPVKTEEKRVTAETLNIRATAASNGKVLASLKKNEIVTVLKTQGTWSNIKTSKGITGWAASQYLGSVTAPPAVETPAGFAYLNTDSNIRSGPGTSSPVILTLKTGTKLQTFEKQKDWTKVKIPDGRTGWVSNKLISAGQIETPVPESPTGVLTGKVIVVDAGHGGYDPGTRGSFTLEKSLTLTSSQLLVKKLQNEGANVKFTRNSDTYPLLSERAALSNKSKADAFISIHYDSGGLKATGISTFYYTFAKDSLLASKVHQNVLAAVKLPDRKASYKNLQVLRENKYPSILVELGFLSNPAEERLITTFDYQEKATNGIVQGLKSYFTK